MSLKRSAPNRSRKRDIVEWSGGASSTRNDYFTDGELKKLQIGFCNGLKLGREKCTLKGALQLCISEQRLNANYRKIKGLWQSRNASLHTHVRMAFCFGFTMFSFRSLKFNELLRSLPAGECTARLGGLRLWCLHHSPSLGLGLTPRSLGRSLSGNARVSIRLLVFGAFWVGAKCAQHSTFSSSQKS